MNTENIKCVMVVNEQVPIGIIANTTAILGISLGKAMPETVGQDVGDKNQNIHKGIIEFPIPILKSDSKRISEIRNKLFNKNEDALTVIDFTTLAQGCKTYDEYIEKMKITSAEHLEYIGIAICGSKKKINKLTGNMPLLR